MDYYVRTNIKPNVLTCRVCWSVCLSWTQSDESDCHIHATSHITYAHIHNVRHMSPTWGLHAPPVSKDPWARGRRKAALCADQCRNYSLFRSFCLLAVLNNSTVSIPHILLVPEGTVPCFPFDSSRLLPSVLANVCSGLMER